jgi:hypothetical protein
MSKTHARERGWWAVVALAVGLSFAGTADAQSRRDRDESLADRVRRQNEVLAQKLEDEVASALAEARRLAAKDPARAAQRLKKTLALVEDDTALTESRRNTLVRVLKDRIRNWTDEADARARSAATHKDNQNRSQLRRDSEENASRERVDRAGRTIRGLGDQVSSSRQLQKEKEAGTRGALTSIDKSMVAPSGEVEFPKDWAQRMKNRKGANSIKLTKKEAAILRTLNSVLSVDFKDQKLEAVIDYLMDKTGQTILVDRESLKEAEVDYETPVTFKAHKVSVRALLRKLLNDLGLTYVIKDEVLQVVTLKKAKEMMVVRAYDVSDLVANLDPLMPLALRQLVMVQNGRRLAEMIKSLVEPQSWAGNGNGGMGTVVFDPVTMSVIVKQSAEIHYTLGGTLGAGR